MERLDVLYAINNKYIDIMLASILSLLENGNVNNLRIHIITSDFTKDDYDKINLFLESFNIEYYFYDIKKFAIEKYHIPNWKESQIPNARLFFQSILGSRLANITNLLYLDADTLVVNSLVGLNNYSSNTINAVRELEINKHCERLKLLNNYYNSGVLYINTSNWCNYGYEEKLIKFIQENKIPLIFPDQDILNFGLKNSIATLPNNYNLVAINNMFKSLGDYLYYGNPMIVGSTKEIKEVKKNPVIIHGTGIFDISPFSYNKLNPYNDIFREYLDRINSNFTYKELESIQKFLANNPNLFKMLYIMQSYLPYWTQEKVRKLAVKVTKR